MVGTGSRDSHSWQVRLTLIWAMPEFTISGSFHTQEDDEYDPGQFMYKYESRGSNHSPQHGGLSALEGPSMSSVLCRAFQVLLGAGSHLITVIPELASKPCPGSCTLHSTDWSLEPSMLHWDWRMVNRGIGIGMGTSCLVWEASNSLHPKSDASLKRAACGRLRVEAGTPLVFSTSFHFVIFSSVFSPLSASLWWR